MHASLRSKALQKALKSKKFSLLWNGTRYTQNRHESTDPKAAVAAAKAVTEKVCEILKTGAAAATAVGKVSEALKTGTAAVSSKAATKVSEVLKRDAPAAPPAAPPVVPPVAPPAAVKVTELLKGGALNLEVKYNQLFINNRFVDSVSGKRFPCINPSNEQQICFVSGADAADVDAAVKAAKKAFDLKSPWRTMDASARGALIMKLAMLIEQNREYIAKLEVMDNGKPLAEADFDVDCSIACLKYYAGWADKIHGQVIPADGGVHSFTRMEPVGVCGQIIPWNYPLLMLTWKFGPALATGNTCILKPAEQTPLSALYVASLVQEAGFPPGVINILPGYGKSAGASLCEHPLVNKIAFTGSTAVGRLIQTMGAKTFKRVSLELGGKSPCVVTENVDVKEAAGIAYVGCMANMGQCCCAGTRTYVHEKVYKEFVDECVKLAKATKVGDPMNPETTQGPQISQIQTDKIMHMIKSGIEQGAYVSHGGSRLKKRGYFVEPTVFSNVTDDMRIAKEEIFGPVMQILRYSDLDDVIQRCNASKYGLGSGIITNNLNQALKFSASIQSGSVWVNCYDATMVQTPFGGFKQSGYGRELGEEGLHSYIERKTVTMKMPVL